MRVTPFGCQTQGFTSASAGGTWESDELDLACGATYYAAVRATNCAGLQRTVASDGAKLCCDPPVTGSVQLIDALEEAVSYVGNGSALPLTMVWFGFSESCSGVRGYSVKVETAAGVPCWLGSPSKSLSSTPTTLASAWPRKKSFVTPTSYGWLWPGKKLRHQSIS